MTVYCYKQTKVNGRHTLKHIAVAEKAIGKRLPKGAVVHHINEDKLDNRPGNLLICSRGYHSFLHMRMNAMAACGNPNWKKCKFCKTYDDPTKMRRSQNYSKDKTILYSGEYWHGDCANTYQQQQRKNRES